LLIARKCFSDDPVLGMPAVFLSVHQFFKSNEYNNHQYSLQFSQYSARIIRAADTPDFLSCVN